MSNDEMRKRLDRLKAQLRETFGSSPGGFMAVLVEGGLTPWPAIAQDDLGAEWLRDLANHETVEDFTQRAARESRASGAKLCTIGGMPLPSASEEMQAAMKAASDYYFEHEYPDVPPCEERGYIRPPSRGLLT
jgi:uncharacterized protein (DUF2235 family)